MADRDLELLQFPTAYPIKVVCRRRAELRIEIDAIVRRPLVQVKHARCENKTRVSGAERRGAASRLHVLGTMWWKMPGSLIIAGHVMPTP